MTEGEEGYNTITVKRDRVINHALRKGDSFYPFSEERDAASSGFRKGFSRSRNSKDEMRKTSEDPPWEMEYYTGGKG